MSLPRAGSRSDSTANVKVRGDCRHVKVNSLCARASRTGILRQPPPSRLRKAGLMLRRTGRCDPIQLCEFVGRVMLDFQLRAARLRLGRGEAAVARPR